MAMDDDRALEEAAGPAARQLALIQTALTLGPILFLGVVAWLALSGSGSGQGPDRSLVDLLSLVHGVLALVAFPMALLFAPRRLPKSPRHDAGRSPGAASERVRAALAAVTVATIVRLAVIEGVALFGAVVLLLAVLGGALEQQPLYALNAVSTLFLVLVSVATFPTRDSVLEQARRRLDPV